MAFSRTMRRVARWALLGTVVAPCLLLALALVLLATETGSSFAAKRVLPLVNQGLRGRLDLGSAQVFPNGRFRIRKVAILGEDGATIAGAEELSGRIELAGLLRRELSIHDLHLLGGKLELRQSIEGTLDLVTALSPRRPSPPSARPSTAPGWEMAIDLAQLEIGHFAYLLAPGPTNLLDVEETSAHGRFALRRDGSLHIQAGIERARWNVPIVLPVQGEVDLEISTMGTLGGKAKLSSAMGGDATLVVRASLENEALSLEIETRGLDLSALRAGLPRTRLTIGASANGPVRPADLRLVLAVAVRDSLIEDVPFGGSLQATAVSSGDSRQLLVEDLGLRLPGASVKAGGKISPSSVDFTANVAVVDAATLTHSLNQGPGLSLPDATGRLTADLQLTGSPESPRLGARFATPGLTVASVHTGPAELSTQSTFAQRFQRLGVQSLNLSLPSGRWTLNEPVDVSFQGGIRISSFELESDPQRIRAQVSVDGSEISAEAEITGLDLERLPLPPASGLRGVAEAHIDYRRRGKADTLHGTLTLNQGALLGLKIASATARVDLEDRRLAGALTVQTSAGALNAQAHVPARWPLGATDAPLSMTAQVHDLALAELQPILAGLSAWEGRGDLSLSVSGSTRHPKVALLVKGQGIRGPWARLPARDDSSPPVPNDELDLALSATWEQALTARLEISRAASAQKLFHATAELGVPASQAVAGQRTRSLFAQAPLSGTIEFAPLDLREAAGLLPLPKGLAGNASISGSVRGSLAKPRGELRLQGEGMAVDRYALGKLAFEISADDRALRAEGTLSSSDGSFALKANLAGPPETLLHGETARTAPLEVHATLAAVPLWTLLQAPEAYQGTLDGWLDLQGSLAAPHATAELRLESAEVGGHPLGEATLDLTWKGSRLSAAFHAVQPTGGEISAQLACPLALGAQPPEGELRGNLRAQGFDLSALSAATSSLHQIAGILDAQVDAAGTLKTPVLTGALSINEASLAVAGFGLFNDIALAAHLSEGSYTLDQLTVRSGKGTATATGALTRGEHGFALQARLDSQGFAIYAADRLIAHLTSSVETTGTLGNGHDQIELRVHHAEIAIPSLTPKSLGAVSLNPDIVMADEKTPATVKKPKPLLVHLLAPGPLILTGPDLTLHAQAGLWARLDPALVLKGGITVTSGGLSLFGKTFTVNEASVEFGDPKEGTFGALGDPLLSARASQEANGTKIVATVNGRLPHPDIVLASEPSMPEDQIIALLLGGAPSSGSQQSGAINPLTNILVNNAVGSNVPVDSLSVSATHVEAGKQLNDQVYLSAAYNNDPDPRANQFEARLGYRLSKSWVVDGKYGTSGAGAVNVVWSHDW
jgi:autotransporter translocation and assembly factor TamB